MTETSKKLQEVAKGQFHKYRSQRDIIRDVMNAAGECDTRKRRKGGTLG